MKSRHHSIRWVYVANVPQNASGQFIELSDTKTSHLRTVLRLSPGDEVRAIDGQGSCYRGLIEKGPGKSWGVRFQERVLQHQRPSHLELLIGFPKNKTMDWIVEKAVECGVTAIRPILTSRSVVMPDPSELGKYVLRWEGIAGEALEQSQQTWMPSIDQPREWLEMIESESKTGLESAGRFVFASEARHESTLGNALSLMKQQSQTRAIKLLIGPEGGFSLEERSDLKRAGYQELSLGSGILRVETAVLTALTLGRICLESD